MKRYKQRRKPTATFSMTQGTLGPTPTISLSPSGRHSSITTSRDASNCSPDSLLTSGLRTVPSQVWNSSTVTTFDSSTVKKPFIQEAYERLVRLMQSWSVTPATIQRVVQNPTKIRSRCLTTNPLMGCTHRTWRNAPSINLRFRKNFLTSTSSDDSSSSYRRLRASSKAGIWPGTYYSGKTSISSFMR